SMLVRTKHFVVLSLLVAGCGSQPEPVAPVAQSAAPPVATPEAPPAPPAPVKPPPSLLAADSPKATSSGATFTAPSGASIATEGALVVLETPEPGSHVVLFDAPSGTAEAAVAAAWAAYRPDAKRPLKLQGPRAARKGWEERRVFEYETSPNERM